MNVLITGNKGFIGQQVEHYLTVQGIRCIGYDLSEGQDLLNKKQLAKYLQGVDYVLHLAAVGNVYQVAQDPQYALQVGIVGTYNLVEAAKATSSVKKIIYVSTWEVYGKSQYEPIDELHPCTPDTPYSIAKYGGELVIRSQTNVIPWLILRLGTVYGSRMRKESVFSRFIERTLKNEPILLQNGGTQKRQFTYIDDVSCALYKSLLSKKKNEIFNIIGDNPITIKQLALLIKNITASTSTITTSRMRYNEPSDALLSNKKAKTLLEWEPRDVFEGAVREMINNFQPI